MKNYAIIVAGGSGSRMKSAQPKQFLELDGKPILMHTINTFYQFDSAFSIILVLPQEQIEFWNNLCKNHHFAIAHEIVAGGDNRFHSVKNGLMAIPDGNGLVAIHDGVRPFVSHTTIGNCFKTAAKYGNAIPTLPMNETVRKIESGKNSLVDRASLKLIQTPQVFSLPLIKKAFEQTYDPSFTDDASVVERTGETIMLVESNRENIKITEPFDLLIAEVILKNLSPKSFNLVG